MMIGLPRLRVAPGRSTPYCGANGDRELWGEHAVRTGRAFLGRGRVARCRDHCDRDLRDLQRDRSSLLPSAADLRSGSRCRDARRPQQRRGGQPPNGVCPSPDPLGSEPGRGWWRWRAIRARWRASGRGIGSRHRFDRRHVPRQEPSRRATGGRHSEAGPSAQASTGPRGGANDRARPNPSARRRSTPFDSRSRAGSSAGSRSAS